MGIVKKLLKLIYESKPISYFRREFNQRASNLLIPLFDRHEQLSADIERLSKQLKQLDTKVSEVHEKINKLPSPSFFSNSLETRFNELFLPLAKAAKTELHGYAPLVFTELCKNLPISNGPWQLNADLLSFRNTQNAPPASQALSSSPSLTEGKRLKILYVCGFFPSIEHGGGLRLYDILTELLKEHEVDLYTHYNADLDEFTLNRLRNKLSHFKITDLAGINISDLRAWLTTIGRENNYYDVIQVEYPNAIPLIKDLKEHGRRVGFTYMECITKSGLIQLDNLIRSRQFSALPAAVTTFWKSLMDEKMALEQADFNIAVTDEDANVLNVMSQAPVEVIPTCISTHEIITPYKEHKETRYKEKSVAFLGYFDHWPNLDAMEWYLRDIHPLVKDKVADYTLFIIGRGNTTKLKAIEKEGPGVIYTGRVDSIVPSILKAQICIAPLISGAGIRGKINQYAVLGRPTVTTSIGNKGIGYVHNNSILIADDATSFAESIVRLLTDDQLYVSIREKAQNHAIEHFTWPQQIQRLTDIYRA